MQPAIQAHNVEMVYPNGVSPVHALKGVSLEISDGEILLMMGPSGSGKTTLLFVLGGILSPTGGRVVVRDVEITNLDRREKAQFRLKHLSFIFQGFNLFKALTARENVELALHTRGVRGRSARERTQQLLERLGLSRQLDRLPRDLSGGEKQRVAIARALVAEPDVVMADEPTSALDAENGLAVTGLLRELARERGTTVLIASHDMRIAPFANRVVQLNDGRL
ncbi:MAG: ABC transporter ATP-binding protein [Candidatus Eremiobacteraeota bacterium]|nr:ABC transporter ATP-binding protein [Candidatus Eremiobacteraeota bacterium]